MAVNLGGQKPLRAHTREAQHAVQSCRHTLASRQSHRLQLINGRSELESLVRHLAQNLLQVQVNSRGSVRGSILVNQLHTARAINLANNLQAI